MHRELAELLSSSESLAAFSEGILNILLHDLQIPQKALVIYDTNKGIVTFPYSSELKESTKPQAYNDINSPLKMVLENNRPLLVEQGDYLRFCQNRAVVDKVPVIWAGCPILKDDQALGAIILSADDQKSVKTIREWDSTLTNFCHILTPYLETEINYEALRGSETKFRHMAESSIDVTFQITLNGYLSYISSNVKTLFGVEPTFLIGKNYQSFSHRSQLKKIEKALRAISTGKTVLNLAITIKDTSGSITPIEINGTPIYKDGAVIGAQGTLRDISERHQAQQEIERLSFFPMTNPMPVVEIDLSGTPSYINPAGIQLLDRMNLDMSQVSQILPPTFKQDINDALNNKGTIPSREVELAGFYLLWSGFFLDNQNLLHYYGTDITTLKNTETELIAAQKTAVKNEQVKTLFLANMSHEIRTPLNSILGFSELIEEEVKDKYDTDLQAYFDIIRVSGKRLWQTVHEILDISQIETGTFVLKIETIDVTKILKELSATFTAAAQEKGIELKVNIPSKALRIAADEYCATQALSNLLDNAIKYTNEGIVEVNAELTGDSVLVQIKDTGIGMSTDYQEQMFKAFSQESTGYTKHFQGVGLGLALAHRYLKLIKSNIELDSTQNVGSTFNITFPINADTPAFQLDSKVTASPEITDIPSRSSDVPISILIVEDDPNSRKLAELTLRKDFTLHFAESVVEAKDELLSNDIQLILLDLSLRGDEDGLDLARYIRSGKELSTIPIIALTAHAFTSDRDRCMEAGCNEFLTKPFRRTDLLEMIYSLVK